MASMGYGSYTHHSAGPSSQPAAVPPAPQSSSDGAPAAATASNTADKALRKSCQHCRKRKIKCLSIPGSASCKACSAKGQPCLFEKQSQMGRPPKAAAAAKTATTAKAAVPETSQSASSLSPKSSSARKRRSLTADANPADGPLKKPKLPTDNDGNAAFSPGAGYHQATQVNAHVQPHHQLDSSHYYQPCYPTTSLHQHPQPRHTTPEWQQPGIAYPLTASASSSATPFSSSIVAHLPTSHLPSPPSLGSIPTAPVTTIPSAHPGAVCIQTETDPLPFFRNSPLHALAAAFHHIFSSAANHLSPASTPALSDPRVSSIARIRTLTARATATRKPVDRSPQAATPNYARSLISPLWDGLPVDIIALTTTGKPSASGPFSISSEVSKRNPLAHSSASVQDEYLYIKLLREDESTDFLLSQPGHASSSSHGYIPDHKGSVFSKNSPGFRYAPEKMTIGKFFTGYFSKHPLAPLVLNERIFLDDLVSNRADSLLLHVIVGSSIAVGQASFAARDSCLAVAMYVCANPLLFNSARLVWVPVKTMPKTSATSSSGILKTNFCLERWRGFVTFRHAKRLCFGQHTSWLTCECGELMLYGAPPMSCFASV